jgi:tetratricopeptide (TPR) repeat protein
VKPALRLSALAASACLAACAVSATPRPAVSSSYADHLVGRLANLRQDHSEAAERYFDALARNRTDPALIEGAVIASLASGDIDHARQAARLARPPDAPAYAHMVRAADDLANGRARQAEDELSHVEGGAAEELVGRMMRVWTRAAQGDVNNVITDLAPLASIRPYGGLFSYQQAMALDFGGQDAAALQAYGIAANGAMFLPPAVEHHAALLARSGARDQALEMLRADVNRSNPALNAAAARIERGETVGQRLTAARGAAVGLYGLAVIFFQEHDSTNGLACLSLALVLDPQMDAARLMFAQEQSKLGHADLARAALTRIQPPSPYADSARVTEAWVLVDQGREEEAIALARASAEGGDLRAKRALADMYRNLRRYNEAEPIYSELIAAQPNDWRFYFARGAARERLGRWPEAEADMRRALELSPEQPDVMNYLGYTWIDRGENLQEGLAMIRRAAELRPMSGQIIDSLGWAYYRMGDYAQAQNYLEAAVELEPADPTLNDHLGDVYWRLGRRIEARFQWQRALTFEPDSTEAIQAKIENGLPEAPPVQSANQ